VPRHGWQEDERTRDQVPSTTGYSPTSRVAPVSGLELLAALLVVAGGSTVQGAVGFGLNLLAVPFLLLIDPELVPGPALIAGLGLALLVAGREFAAMDRRLGFAYLGLVPGAIAGVLVVAVVPQGDLSVALGVLVLVAVVLSAVRWQPVPRPSTLTVAGAASGFLAGAASVGGPPMALLYAREDAAKLRSTVSGFFVVTAILSLALLAAVGHFAVHDLWTSLTLLPAVVIGFALSGPLRKYVDRGGTRPFVLGLSALAAVIAIVEGLLG
jgi:uncharacterized protein